MSSLVVLASGVGTHPLRMRPTRIDIDASEGRERAFGSAYIDGGAHRRARHYH